MPAGVDEIYRSLRFDKDEVNFSKWPKLSCSAANELTLATPPTQDDPNPGVARLAIAGELKLQIGVAVNELSSDGKLTNNSDLAIPTQKAVKTYVDNQITVVNQTLSTKAALNGASSQDFQSKNLSVSGNLTTSGNVTTTGSLTIQDNLTVVAGRVGIGTSTPSEKLEVNGSIKLETGVPVNEFSSDETFVGNSNLAVPTEQAVKTYIDTQIGQVNGALSLKAALAGSAAQDFQARSLIADDSVGIGTIPSEKLAVAGNALIEGDLYLNRSNYVSLHYGNRGKLGETPSFNPDNDNNGLWLEASNDSESGGIFCNGNTIVLWSPGDNDTLRIYDEDNFSSPKFVINNEGNVGIGTTSPAAKLEISDSFRGSLKFLPTSGVGHDLGYDGGSDNSFWFTHYGAESGETKFVWDNGSGVRDLLVIKNDGQLIGRQIQPSSIKLKENIVDLSSQEALKTLKELNPVKFNYRGDSQGKLNVGFIAEDVPDLVATSDRKGLSPIDIVAVLTKVVKEQQNTISVLAEKIKALEEKQN